ncbi:MAG: STAS domain-containing protein [Phycisphaerales bacterium]|nr:STAS domain-containing protein [Phycisphaerales bacterium]
MTHAHDNATKLTVHAGPQAPDGVVVVALRGSADIHSDAVLEEALERVEVAKPRRVVFDLRGLDILTSLAIGVLVGFRARVLHRGGTVVMACVPEPIVKSMRFTRVSALFQCFRTVEEAHASGGGTRV